MSLVYVKDASLARNLEKSIILKYNLSFTMRKPACLHIDQPCAVCCLVRITCLISLYIYQISSLQLDCLVRYQDDFFHRDNAHLVLRLFVFLLVLYVQMRSMLSQEITRYGKPTASTSVPPTSLSGRLRRITMSSRTDVYR